jgi:hypothetical protein
VSTKKANEKEAMRCPLMTLSFTGCPLLSNKKLNYALNVLSRSALVSTDTELRLMAAAANMGFKRGPPKR